MTIDVVEVLVPQEPSIIEVLVPGLQGPEGTPGSAFDYATRALFRASIPSLARLIVSIARYADDRPFAPSYWRRVDAEPGHRAKDQDASGQWWEEDSLETTPEVHGAYGLGDPVQNDAPALATAMSRAGGICKLRPGAHYYAIDDEDPTSASVLRVACARIEGNATINASRHYNPGAEATILRVAVFPSPSDTPKTLLISDPANAPVDEATTAGITLDVFIAGAPLVGLSIGDPVQLGSNGVAPNGIATFGELNWIRAITDLGGATKYKLHKAAEQPYLISEAAFIRKVDYRGPCTMRGVTLIGKPWNGEPDPLDPEGLFVGHVGVFAIGVERMVVEHCKFIAVDRQCCKFDACVSYAFRHNQSWLTPPPANNDNPLQYTFVANTIVVGGEVSYNLMVGGRHGAIFAGSAIGGYTRDTVVSHNLGYGQHGATYATHVNSARVVFDGNSSIDAERGYDIRVFDFEVRNTWVRLHPAAFLGTGIELKWFCSRGRIVNARIEGGPNGSRAFNDSTAEFSILGDLEILNSRLWGQRFGGIVLQQIVTTTPLPKVRILNTWIHNSGGASIEIDGPFVDSQINDNYISQDDETEAPRAMILNGLSSSQLAGNFLSRTAGILVDEDVTTGTVPANVFFANTTAVHMKAGFVPIAVGAGTNIVQDSTHSDMDKLLTLFGDDLDRLRPFETVHTMQPANAAVTGTLRRIVGGGNGQLLTLSAAAGTTVAVVQTANIALSAGSASKYPMSGTDTLTLRCDENGNWREIARTPVMREYKSAGIVTHTGDTNAFALATVAIPGGALGPSGYLRIEGLLSYTNNGNSKNLAVTFGGVTFFSATGIGTAANKFCIFIHNSGGEGAQESAPAGLGSFGTSTGTPVSAAVDTTVAQNVVFQCQLTNAADEVKLRSWSVEVHPGA